MKPHHFLHAPGTDFLSDVASMYTVNDNSQCGSHMYNNSLIIISFFSLQGFVVKNYGSLQELSAAFQDINMKELCHQIALFVE